MGQIHGSGTGNWNNAAVVDNSLGSQQGRLYTNSMLVGSDGYFYQDKSSSAIPIINYSHHKIHDGNHFNIKSFTTLSLSGDKISFGVTTNNGSKWCHLSYYVEGTTQTESRIWEGATISGGTIVTAINNNRNGNIISVLDIKLNPVISGASPTSGLLISSSSAGYETIPAVKADLTSDIERENELILKSGTSYLIEIKSVGSNNIVDYRASWYEHADRIKQF